MTKSIEDLFLYGAIYTALLPIVFFVFTIRKTKFASVLFLVCGYSIVEFITNIISLDSSYETIAFVYSTFTVLEFWFFALIIRSFIKTISFRNYILMSGTAFTIFATTYYITANAKGLDSIPIGVETILILSSVFFFLYEQMSEVTQDLIYTKYSFWIVTGILTYLSGSFFIYILSNQVSEEVRNAYWMFTNVFTILKNIAFSISIFLVFKENSSSKCQSLSKLI